MRRPHDDPATYLAAIDDPVQRALVEHLRALVRQVAPQVEETIAYGMLSYPGLASLAAQKRHVALYVDPDIVQPRRHLLPGIDCGRSCMRFQPGRPVPDDGVRAILAARWALTQAPT